MIYIPFLKAEVLGFVKRQYVDGNLAVAVLLRYDPNPKYEDEGGEEEQIISCNLPEDAHLLEEGEFFLKDWSENECIIEALDKEKLLDYRGDYVPTGRVMAKVVCLSLEAEKMLVKGE